MEPRTPHIECSNCGTKSAPGTRICPGCRRGLENEVVLGACPLCGCPEGDGRIKFERHISTRVSGVPLIASTTTRTYALREFANICAGCSRKLFGKQAMAWTLQCVPMGLLVIAGLAVDARALLALAVASIIVLPQVRYGVVDSLVWGGWVLERFGAPRGSHEIPVSNGQLALRMLVLAFALVAPNALWDENWTLERLRNARQPHLAPPAPAVLNPAVAPDQEPDTEDPTRSWTMLSADGRARLRQRVSGETCLVDCAVDGGAPKWSDRTCLATKDEPRFVAPDCERTVVLIPAPARTHSWAAATVMRVYARGKLEYAVSGAAVVPEISVGSLTLWIQGYRGVRGEQAHYSQDGRRVEYATVDGKPGGVSLFAEKARPPR